MRTTLTLDDDVAGALDRMQVERGASLKQVVNDALRAGIAELAAQQPPRRPFVTRAVSHGRSRVGDLADVSEALALAEGDDHR